MTGGRTTHPLTPDRFSDLVRLFESDGETRSCWCLWWRVRASEWKGLGSRARRDAFKAAVEQGPPPGVLLYRGAAPVGWVQVTPRAAVPRFNNARSAKPRAGEDDLERVWIISCFFLHKDVRGQGLMVELARAACAHAAAQGAVAVDAAPIAPRRPLIWGEGFVGIHAALERAGFRVLEQRTELRALMRWTP